MVHSFVSSFPPQANVRLPLNRPQHLFALMRELELLGYVIDQATHHWEAVWHTKGHGTISALTTLLKVHDRRVKLLGLHNPVPGAEPDAPVTASPPPAPEAPLVVPAPEVAVPASKPVPVVVTSAVSMPPLVRPTVPPREVVPPPLLPLDGLPNDLPHQQRDFRVPRSDSPQVEWDFLVT